MRTRRLRVLTTLMTLAAMSTLTLALLSPPAGAAGPGQVVVTEWMYNSATSGKPEFVEITNVGGTPVDLSTYSFDDSSRTPGSFPLAALGSLAPGESGLIVEGTAAAFRTEWGLGATVKIADGNTNNLGRDDEINIYNGTTLADRLTYGDDLAQFAGSIRTSGTSGVAPSCQTLGANNVGSWVFSQVGDASGAKKSVSNDLASPGTTNLGACGPVPIVGGDGSAGGVPCQPEAASGTGPAPANAQPWPGATTVTVADQLCAWKTATGPEGRDMSGLVFDPSNPNVLWAVKNKSWVFRLVKQGSTWVPDTANDWGGGKQLFFPGGTGQPDSEGLTVGPDGALYVTTERDNANNAFALNSVLRFDPSAAGTTLTATQQWDLTADFPELIVPGGDKTKANLGFEGVSYVPGAFLVANHFVDQSTAAAYDPANYPGHGFGLYFAALENDGKLYAYALGTDGSHHRIATVDTGMGHVMDVQYDADLGRVWALCDNTCSVSSTVLKIGATGAMVPDVVYAKPADLPVVNIEGFAIAPDSTCANGVKEVVWSDDGISAAGHEGHALYSGTFPCGQGSSVKLTLLGTNDFHGRIDTNTVQYAGTVEQLRAAAGEKNAVFVGAGDLVGASLFASAVAQDQPTIDVMNALHLDVSAVGNHEFDQGYGDLVNRIVGSPRNAQWDYLGANVYQSDGVTPALPEYSLLHRDGLTIGVIGAVTQETPALVSPGGVAGLVFGDPVGAVNRVAAQLSDGNAANGEADVIVAAYHEGAPAGDPATLEQQVTNSPVFAKIVNQTSPAVDAIFTGHTHEPYAYDGPVPGQAGQTRPIIQTGSYGDHVGEVTLTVDTATHAITAHTERNVTRTTTAAASLIATYPRVAAVNGIVTAALANADQVGSQVVGQASADITTAYTGGSYQGGVYVGSNPANPTQGRDDRASESTLGNFVADSLLDSLASPDRGGAEIGVVNPGGLRAELFHGDITYAEANSVLPFVNNLWTTSLTGAQVKTMLEQQWQRDAAGNVPSRPYLQLGLSKNVSYTYDATRPEGDRITSITVNGAPIDPTRAYRIGTFSFLTQGGDNFRVLAQGTDARDSGLIDRDGWISYLTAHSPVAPSFARRATVVSPPPTSKAAGANVTFDVSKLDLTSLGSPQNTSLDVQLDGASIGTAPVTGGAAHVDVTIPLVTAPGAKTLTLVAAPSGTTVQLPLTVTAAAGGFQFATTSLPDGTVGTPYSKAIQVVGGTSPFTFKANGGLPAGLTLDATTGVLSGTPTAPGKATFTVTATDSAHPKHSAKQDFTVVVAPTAIVVTPTSAPNAVVGASYKLGLSASGGSKPYDWSISAGTLPAGLTLKSNGSVGGKATVPGTFTFTVRATDKFGFTGEQAYTVVVSPSLHVVTTTLPDGTVGVAYDQPVVAADGTAPYAYSASGALPTGVTIDHSTGVLAGTPTAPGSYTFTVSVSDQTQPKETVKQKYTVQIAPAAVAITPSTAPGAQVGRTYKVSFAATGGTKPYTWSIVAGSLPPGLAINANGVVSGKPTAAGAYGFTVRATDRFGYSGDLAVTITVS